MKITGLIFGFCFLSAIALAAEPSFGLFKSGEVEENSVLASVNGEAITLKDVIAESALREFPLYAANPDAKTYEAVAELRRQVLDEIIDRKLLLQQYDLKPFNISTQYLESYIDEAAQRAGARSRSEFAAKLRDHGDSIEEFRAAARERMISEVMLSRAFAEKVNVTPKMIREFYQANPKWNYRSARIHLFIIRTNEEITLRNEGEFLSYARTKSTGPNASSGGDMGWVERDLLRPEFQKEMFYLIPNEVYGPVRLEDGIYYFYTKEVVAQVNASFDIAGIRDKLESEQREAAKAEYLRKLRDQSSIIFY